MTERAEQLTVLWWIRLPQAVRRLALRLVLVLVDGLFISVWPRVAAIASPLVLVLGLLLGAVHPGFGEVFSESWLVLSLAVFLGVFSGHLGALFLAGFAFGDFFFYHSEWVYRGSFISNVVRIRVPLLIEYGLLAFMTTGIALATKSLLTQLRPPQSLPRQARTAIAIAGHFVLTLLFVYLWMQVVPILIRPVFTWQGGSPTVAAMALLQQSSWPFLAVAGMASLGRMGLQQMVARNPEWNALLDVRERQLNEVTPLAPLASGVPLMARVALMSLWSTLMLAGMLEAWWDGLILLIVITVLQMARARLLIPQVLMPWARVVERIPHPVRLVAGILLTTVLARLVLAPALTATNSFRPILLLTIFALFVFYLLDPLRDEVQPAAS